MPIDVLIIEDDELACTYLERIVAALGKSALGVTSLAEAQQAMSAVYFPVVVLDRGLEDGDGLELCRAYRTRYADNGVQIAIWSGRATESDIEAGRRAGADLYLSKSMSDDDLSAALKALLARGHQDIRK